jgi:hypothetical protein
VALDAIREPLSRIPVRQDVIKDAAPDNRTVTSQADATKADAKEATAAVDQVRKQQENRIRELQTEVDELQGSLEQSRSQSDQNYRRVVNWIRVFCIIGIGGGVVLCFLIDRRLVVVTFAAVAMLGAVAVERFTWVYGMPIAAGAIGLLVLIGAWYLWRYLRANRELVASGQHLIARAGGMTSGIKSQLDRIQSAGTKRIVNRFAAKPTAPPQPPDPRQQ